MISVVTITCTEDQDYLLELSKTIPEYAEWILINTVHKDYTDKDLGLHYFEQKGNIRQYIYVYEGLFGYKQARNEGIELASNNWIFQLDTDERFPLHQHNELLETIKYVNDRDDIYGLTLYVISIIANGGGYQIETPFTTRIFRKDKGIKYISKVHESVEPVINELGGQIAKTNLIILHEGYKDADKMVGKFEKRLKGWLEQPEIPKKYPAYFDLMVRDAYNLYKMNINKGDKNG